MDEFGKIKEETLCLPTDEASKLLKDGLSMPDVVAKLGTGAWQRVSVSALGVVNGEDLTKIKHLAQNWSAVVTNYMVSLEDTHGAAGNSI